MPNYVKNVLKIKNLTPREMENLVHSITTNMLDIKTNIIKCQTLDFNKITPEPKTQEECPDKYIIKKDDTDVLSHSDSPTWFNWYDWRLEYWGTKWNAMDCEIVYNASSILFIFNTAWEYPEPIIRELANRGYFIELWYADEDRGSNLGYIVAEPNDDDDKSYSWNEVTDFEQPERMADTIWDEM